MEAAPSHVDFEHLPMARADFSTDVLSGYYRVYTDKQNFKMIQATSALEALEQSGFRHAFKIEREDLLKYNLLSPPFWQSQNHASQDAAAQPVVMETPAEPAATVATEPAAAAAEPSAEPAPAAAASAETLSNDDIDKLLNN